MRLMMTAMLSLIPAYVPALPLLLSDLGNPEPAAVAQALGLTARTVTRWGVAGDAPLAARLALFWVTRWGQSAVDAAAVNDARMYAGLALCLRGERDALRARVAHLELLSDFGCANAPRFRSDAGPMASSTVSALEFAARPRPIERPQRG